MRKTFTVDEAVAALPLLGGLLGVARAAAVKAGEMDGEMQSLSQRIFLSGGMHVDVAAAARRRAERDKAVQAAREKIEEIEEAGAQVGDMGEGRLEFPCVFGGREVLLCWMLGEDVDEIRQWREDADGAELQPIVKGMFGWEGGRLN